LGGLPEAAIRSEETMASTSSVSPKHPSKSLNQEVDGLLSGTKWSDLTISYSFPESASDYESKYEGNLPKKNLVAFDDAEKTAVGSIFDNISAVTLLEFNPYPPRFEGSGYSISQDRHVLVRGFGLLALYRPEGW
jgi:hypothetical protein